MVIKYMEAQASSSTLPSSKLGRKPHKAKEFLNTYFKKENGLQIKHDDVYQKHLRGCYHWLSDRSKSTVIEMFDLAINEYRYKKCILFQSDACITIDEYTQDLFYSCTFETICKDLYIVPRTTFPTLKDTLKHILLSDFHKRDIAAINKFDYLLTACRTQSQQLDDFSEPFGIEVALPDEQLNEDQNLDDLFA